MQTGVYIKDVAGRLTLQECFPHFGNLYGVSGKIRFSLAREMNLTSSLPERRTQRTDASGGKRRVHHRTNAAVCIAWSMSKQKHFSGFHMRTFDE